MSDPVLPDIRSVFDASHHFMGVLSPGGILLDANGTALKAAGVSLAEIQGRHFWNTPWWIHDPVQQDLLKAGIRQAAQGEPFRMEATHSAADGSMLVVDFTITPLRDAGGRVVALLPEGRDITDLAQERRRLQLSESRFRSLVEHAMEAIVMLDLDTARFVDVNAGAETLFKASRDRLLELGPVDLSPDFQPDGRPSHEAAAAYIEEAVDQGTATFDWTHQAVDGEWIPCEIRLLKLPGSEGCLLRGSIVDLRPRLARESSLRESESKFRLLFERSVDGLLLLDEDRFSDCNQAVLDMMRCTQPEFLRLHPWDLSPPTQPDGRASDEKARAMIAAAYAQGGHRFEWTHRRTDGSDFPVEVTLIPIPLKGREILFTSWRDITERKAAERALEESARTIGLIVDQTGQMVYDFDLLLGRIRWFGAVEDLTGLSIQQLEAKSHQEWRKLFHPEDREPAARSLDAAIRDCERYCVAYRMFHQDGSVRWMEDTGVVLAGPDGKPARMLGSMKNITDRIRQEEALRASEERFRVMVRNAQDTFVLINAQGEQTFISPVAERLTGFRIEELLGSIERIIHPEDWPAVQKAWIQVLTQPESVVRVEYRHIHKTQGHVWFEAVAQNCLEEPAIRAVAVSVRDITERKRAELERLSLERQMLHTQKLESLGVLAGGIAHDFNNLLTAILGNLNLAQAGLPEDNAVHSHLEATERAVLKASELTRQMLAYSGKGRFVVKAHNFNQVVREMAHLVQVSIAKKIRLRFGLQEGLPSVEADGAQIQQVILNLVTNANDAIGDREGVIHIATYSQTLDEATLHAELPGQELRPGLYTVLEIGDTGVGMTPEIQARIFDPFFTTKAAGHGLGLSAMLGILKGHRGGITVHSEPGQGTTFKLYFPATPEPLPPTQAIPTPKDSAFSGLVLLVDDEAAIREVTAQALELLGFEVETAFDGQDAVERFSLRPEAYRIVLMDLTMPRMDGRECFRALRALRPDLKVILCSGFSEQESMAEFLGNDLSGFIQKPYTLKTLRQAFAEVLRVEG